jgi:ATP-dependent DNA helicase PIF1
MINAHIVIHLREALREILREADLIVWDEAPMAPIMALKTIDRLLRKIINKDLSFGGKVIVLESNSNRK